MKFALAIIAVLCLFSGAAQARHHGHHGHRFVSHHRVAVHHYAYLRHHRHYHRGEAVGGIPGGSLVTVPTAAGISITVASGLASQFQGVIADLVAAGYKPRHIGGFATGGHVSHSRHYAGAAIDIDQSGWGRTTVPHHLLAEAAARHGLRDGASFGDAGHIDDGQALGTHHYASLRHRRYGG